MYQPRVEAQEQFALKISIGANLVFAALGFGFAVFTRSEAVLLDGAMSLANCIMAALTLIIAQIVQRPDDDSFHFGYAHFEPLLNVFKALIIVAIAAFALVSALTALLHGGRAFVTGPALLYATLTTLFCLAITALMYSQARTSHSSLVAVDATNWLIDALISSAICLTFIVVSVLERTTWAPYLVYADPALVTILVLIAIPIPLTILKDNVREALMVAPKREIQNEITSRFRQALEVYGFRDIRLRMVKTGRLISVLAHVLVPEHFRLERVKELDSIRAHINEAFRSYQPQVVIEVIFTEDQQWLQ